MFSKTMLALAAVAALSAPCFGDEVSSHDLRSQWFRRDGEVRFSTGHAVVPESAFAFSLYSVALEMDAYKHLRAGVEASLAFASEHGTLLSLEPYAKLRSRNVPIYGKVGVEFTSNIQGDDHYLWVSPRVAVGAQLLCGAFAEVGVSLRKECLRDKEFSIKIGTAF